MLLLEQCEQLSLNGDSALLSKAAFRFQRDAVTPAQLWWRLDLLHEKLISKGEKRKLYRWVCFLKDAVSQTKLLSGNDVCKWLHMRSSDLPHNALPHHVATSTGLIAFIAFVLRDGRTSSIIDFCRSLLANICARAVAHLTGPVEIIIGDDIAPLRVLPGGLVQGSADAISSRHAMVWQTWQNEWLAMHEQQELSSLPDDASLLLTDLVKFSFEIDRRRRSTNKHIWPRDSQTGMTLHSVLKGLVVFLSHHLDDFVLNYFVHEHDCSEAVPSRRRSNGGGEVAKRIQMSADTIFEIIQDAKDSGLSMREAVNFLKRSGRLSAAAGTHPNATDAWMRRHQKIYDDRAVIAFAGTNHLNLIADGSKHAGKEVLVTVAYSWENNTAAFAPVQVIMPLDDIAPGEMDLTSLIEKLAKDV